MTIIADSVMHNYVSEWKRVSWFVIGIFCSLTFYFLQQGSRDIGTYVHAQTHACSC